ncbi:MAG TPA: PDZ domain-containing protein, partial [Planctomycetota bacterium]|nr:PDZ domain-containing protein [Planctomycetota bacterium]
GPAGKAGMKAGDRIVDIQGTKIESVEDLYSVVDSLEPGSTIKVKLLRVEKPAEEKRPDEPKPGEQPPPQRPPQRQPGQGQRLPEDGAWSYYQMGAMTFCTATAVLALMDAKEVGCQIPQEAIDRGLRFVEALRLPKEGHEESYAYRQGVTRGPAGDLRGAIGRIAVCELALFRAGKSDQAYLGNALRIFVEKRGELDRVRGYPGNHFSRSFMNAAYYFLYGHYNSALALHQLKDAAARKKHGAFIQEALLKLQHPEGTWTDHEAWGQLYGTAMAMMALGELRFVTPDAYSKPIASVEAKAPRKIEENEY